MLAQLRALLISHSVPLLGCDGRLLLSVLLDQSLLLPRRRVIPGSSGRWRCDWPGCSSAAGRCRGAVPEIERAGRTLRRGRPPEAG
jgi:hypothetical protein